MADIRDRAIYEAAIGRDRHLQRQLLRQRRQETLPKPASYQGYDAAQGRHLVQELGEGTVPGMISLTNAGLAVGDAVESLVGAGAIDSRPRICPQPELPPVLAGPEASITALLTASIRSTEEVGGPLMTQLFFWLKQPQQEAQRFEIPIAQSELGSGLEWIFFGDLQVLERDRFIVQIYFFGSARPMPTVGAESLVFYPQPIGFANGFYDLYPYRLEQKLVDLLTIYVEAGQIRLIEGTLALAAVESFDFLTYSEFWQADLDYLRLTATNLYSVQAEPEPQIVTYSPLGRFEAIEPDPLNYLALKNFFGAEPTEYFLGDGDRAQLPLTLEELGMEQLATTPDATNGLLLFPDWIQQPDEAGRYPSVFQGFVGQETGVFWEIYFEVSSVRGIVQ